MERSFFDLPEIKAWIAEVNAAADAGGGDRLWSANVHLGRAIRIAQGAERGVTLCPLCGYGEAGKCCLLHVGRRAACDGED